MPFIQLASHGDTLTGIVAALGSASVRSTAADRAIMPLRQTIEGKGGKVTVWRFVFWDGCHASGRRSGRPARPRRSRGLFVVGCNVLRLFLTTRMACAHRYRVAIMDKFEI